MERGGMVDGLAIEPAEQDRAQRSAAGGRRVREKSTELSVCAQTVGRRKVAATGQQRDFWGACGGVGGWQRRMV